MFHKLIWTLYLLVFFSALIKTCSSTLSEAKRRRWRAPIVAIYRPLGTRMLGQDLSPKAKNLFFSFFFFIGLFFLNGLAFVCLPQTFCCEGFELILLIVLPGRNLDLNLLWNLVPDNDIPLGQYQRHCSGAKCVVVLNIEKKIYNFPSILAKLSPAIGLSWLLSTPNLPPVFPNSEEPVSIISSGAIHSRSA